MSKEGDRASVLKTSKVRTKLKGDASWMQRLSEPQSETEEEKPWMAEVRVNRLNGAPIDTSPIASPTSKTPPSPTRPAEDGGVFTETDTKPAANSSTSNGFSGSTSSFTKRPSESYKRIAPHTVRPTSNLPVQTEDQLSPEENEKREEAAMNVLKTSSVRQCSYVLSAANKYDCTDKPPETSLTTDVTSFVAKRVVITDNDDSIVTETPSVPKEPAAPSVKDVSPVSVKDVPSVSVKDVPSVSVKDVSPVSVKDVPPVSVKDVPSVSVKDVSPVSVKDVSPVSVKDVSPVSVKDVPPVSVKDVPPVSVKDVPSVSVKDVPSVSVKDVSPVSVKDVSPVPVKDVPPVSVKDVPSVSVKDVSPVSVKDVSPVSVKDVSPVSVKDISPVSVKDVSPVSVKDVPSVSVKDVPSVSVKDVPSVSVKDVPSVPVKDVSPVPVKDVSPISVKDVPSVSVKDVPSVSVKDVSPISVKDVPSVSVKDFPSVSVKDFPSVSVKDVPPVSVKNVPSVSVKDVSPVSVKDVPSVSVVDIHVCVKDVLLSSPVIVDTPAVIDPYEGMKPGLTKVATELSPESSVLLKVVSPVSPVLVSPVPYKPVKTDPAPVDTLTALSDTLISFDTDSSSSRVPDPVWTETAEPEDRLHGEPIPQLMVDDLLDDLTNGLEEELVKPIPPSPGLRSQELLSGSDRDIVSTEVVSPDSLNPSTDSRDIVSTEVVSPDSSNPSTDSRSSDIDSPWDRWSAPTVYKEKEDSSSSYSRTLDSSANQRPKSPDTESKKCFVYLKEYVDVTDLTKHNTRDNDHDYVTSSSTSHSYSSPSSYTRSTMTSACTYCGEQVGNDAKITIEHLNISCHPACFKCGVCSKPMGDFLFNMFLHKGKVHCESCYANVL
ncbi:proteoglycan 4-like isoform X2 [Oncorhynchus masou masou]|uniref:proteoglycan 4-like isoform X2 n=1 Tax=Oncorhynchus masou masou TaxID=90313 RepID=UPI003182F2A3